MAKIRTSKKHAGLLRKRRVELKLHHFEGLKRVHPLKELADPEQTALAIFECLMNNDPDGVMEMIELYLSAVNKTNLMKETLLPKSTLYSTLKHRNPTIKTLAKLMSAAN